MHLMRTVKITKSGGVTIPRDLRLDMGISAGDLFDLSVSRGNVITLSATRPKCAFCGSMEQKLHAGNGVNICTDCVEIFSAKG
jgi:transcriptional pleiotropic regulator of transition state genes